MVVDPMNSAQLVRPLLSAIAGSALQQEELVPAGEAGAEGGGDKFTLVDEPHLTGAPGARYFDGEGWPPSAG